MYKKYMGIATLNSILRTNINEYIKNELKMIDNNELVPSYGSILSIVLRHGGTTEIKTICEILKKQKPTITEMINRLEKIGYLKKFKSSSDRRITYVSATNKTYEFKEDLDRISLGLIEKIFNGFTDEERDLFTLFMERAMNNFLN